MKICVAKVAVELSAVHFDKPYSYLIPRELEDKAKPGCRVVVPFGGGNRKKPGFILEVGADTELEKIKPILTVLDDSPVLSDEMIKLAYRLKETTFCTLYDAAKTMLPAGINVRMVVSYRIADGVIKEDLKGLDDTLYLIASSLLESLATVERKRLLEIAGLAEDSNALELLVKKGLIVRADSAVRRIGDATVKMARLNIPAEEALLRKLTEKQKSIVNVLDDVGCASVKELCYFTGVGASVVTALAQKGIVEIYEEEIYRSVSEYVAESGKTDIELTDEQKKAYEDIKALYDRHEAGAALLYGVTGSGKTSVFMKLIDDVIADGTGVIVMVPEIALTPQTLERFGKRYGGRVAVFHSALSVGQRLDEWKRVKNGDALIAIGTRSAVFAPFEKLGLIVIDEEHETTYKSSKNPRFHARDVSKFRCAYHKCPLVLSSATPSVESFYYASTGKYLMCRLTDRYGGASLPNVLTVDMRAEPKGELLSGVLKQAIEENLENGMQSILLLNRRGYNTFVSCNDCGHVVTCPHCSISMTYHRANNRLMCHYCGFSVPLGYSCPECGGNNLRYAGQGTQRIEEVLENLYPSARILRMDADSTMTKNSYEKKLGAFAAHKYDIMLGTQMVAKGLDFPLVTLVGIISADQMLYSDDFRSYERSFSLITQVVGRSGRGENLGRAIIQTTTPDSDIIELAARQDYDAFYKSEILLRKSILYPPFADICLISFTGQDEQKTYSAACFFSERLQYRLTTDCSDLPIRILGPSAALVARLNGNFRYKLIIKCRSTIKFRDMIADTMHSFGREKSFADVTVSADIDPENVS
ncbi:MAG: primosomal protein N' [Clostridia bacterium]|nr:primosomal protein N' [Clostridia bacterium]